MISLVVIFNMVTAIIGYVITNNSALQRPSCQISNHTPFEAGLAVDGNKSSNLSNDKSCSHTIEQNNPWWAVELEEPLDVVRVDIINRRDCCAERLHDFNVGISDVSPEVRAPIPGEYPLCSHYTGAVDAGAQVNITCDNNIRGRHIGRYVIIQIVSSPEWTNDILTLCEVSVYAAPVKLPIVHNPAKAKVDRKMAAEFHTGIAFTTSKINCIALCHNQAGCGSVNFRRINGRIEGECELNRIKYHVLVDDGDDGSIRAQGWHLYNLI